MASEQTNESSFLGHKLGNNLKKRFRSSMNFGRTDGAKIPTGVVLVAGIVLITICYNLAQKKEAAPALVCRYAGELQCLGETCFPRLTGFLDLVHYTRAPHSATLRVCAQ